MDVLFLLLSQAGWKRKDASGNDIFADQAYIQSLLANVISFDIGGDLHEYYVGDHAGTATGELLGYDPPVSPDLRHFIAISPSHVIVAPPPLCLGFPKP